MQEWQDQSGKQRHLAQGEASLRPDFLPFGLNGQPALHFYGEDFLASVDGMPRGDCAKLVVLALQDFGLLNNLLSGAYEHALFYGFSNSAMLYRPGTFVTSNRPTALGQATILVASYDASTRVGSLYQDGVWVGTGTAAPNTDQAIQAGILANCCQMQGMLGEVLHSC